MTSPASSSNARAFRTDPPSRVSLLNLALCSHRFHELVEPILYSHFFYNHGITGNEILKFLVRILARPDLGRRVRTIRSIASPDRVEYYESGEDYATPAEYPYVTADDWARIRLHVAALGLQLKCDWVKAIEDGNWEAILAMILTLMPNLEVLELKEWRRTDKQYPTKQVYYVLSEVFRQARQLQVDRQTQNPLGMWTLARVEHESWEGRYGIGTESLIRFAALESMRTVWAERVVHGDRPIRRGVVKPNYPEFTGVEELSLKWCSVNMPSPKRCLRAFPCLRRLRCSYRGAHYLRCFGRYLRPAKLMEAITHLAPYLEDLTVIDKDAFRFRQGFDLSWYYCMGSCASFHNLRRLDMNWRTLIGGGLVLEDSIKGWAIEPEPESAGEDIDGDPVNRDIPITSPEWSESDNEEPPPLSAERLGLDIIDALPPNLEWLHLREP